MQEDHRLRPTSALISTTSVQPAIIRDVSPPKNARAIQPGRYLYFPSLNPAISTFPGRDRLLSSLLNIFTCLKLVVNEQSASKWHFPKLLATIEKPFDFVSDKIRLAMVFAVVQYFSSAVLMLLLKIFTNLSIEGRNNLRELSGPFVLVSNHESHLDPPLTGVALLGRPSLFPLRFMAKNELFKIPVFNLIIWLLGAFKAHRKAGIGKSLLTPTRILEQGGSVIMFPEGRIIPPRPHLGEGRRGAAILALTTRAVILPMSLHTPANFSLIDFLFQRRKVVIRIGEPFYLNNLDYPDFSDENTYRATQVIMQKISDLYYLHKY